MKRVHVVALLTASAIIVPSYSAYADVRAEQKTRVELAGVLGRVVNMFGGRGAREGVTSTVIVKGDRMATVRDDTEQIVDLAEEKVYDVDLKKKSYKVTTFAELRRRWEEQQKKAADNARRQEPRDAKAEKDPNANDVEIDFDLKNTGEKKAINGFDTQQQVMTITVREKGKTLEQSGGVVLTADMWMAPTVTAMKEVAEFSLKFAQKVYGGVAGLSADQMAAALAMYPQLKQAMGRMTQEGARLQGTPIETITTMDVVKSAEQAAQDAKSTSAANDDDKPQSGLSGFLAKKLGPKKDDNADKPRSTFMTTTHDVLKLSTDVGAADVAIPAGFKENK